MADYYTVQSGDSYERIAQKLYGNERMFAELMKANGGVFLKPGMTLAIPANISNPNVTQADISAANFGGTYDPATGKMTWGTGGTATGTSAINLSGTGNGKATLPVSSAVNLNDAALIAARNSRVTQPTGVSNISYATLAAYQKYHPGFQTPNHPVAIPVRPTTPVNLNVPVRPSVLDRYTAINRLAPQLGTVTMPQPITDQRQQDIAANRVAQNAGSFIQPGRFQGSRTNPNPQPRPSLNLDQNDYFTIANAFGEGTPKYRLAITAGQLAGIDANIAHQKAMLGQPGAFTSDATIKQNIINLEGQRTIVVNEINSINNPQLIDGSNPNAVTNKVLRPDNLARLMAYGVNGDTSMLPPNMTPDELAAFGRTVGWTERQMNDWAVAHGYGLVHNVGQGGILGGSQDKSMWMSGAKNGSVLGWSAPPANSVAEILGAGGNDGGGTYNPPDYTGRDPVTYSNDIAALINGTIRLSTG